MARGVREKNKYLVVEGDVETPEWCKKPAARVMFRTYERLNATPVDLRTVLDTLGLIDANEKDLA